MFCVSSQRGSPARNCDVQIFCKLAVCEVVDGSSISRCSSRTYTSVSIPKRKHLAEIAYHQYLRVSQQVTYHILQSNTILDRQQRVSFRSLSSPTIYVLDGFLDPWPCLRCSSGGGGVQFTFKPLANHDSDRPGKSHCRVREYHTADQCGEPRQEYDAPHNYEEVRDDGHHFRMLGNQVVERVVQPDWRILHHRGDCVPALLVSNMPLMR